MKRIISSLFILINVVVLSAQEIQQPNLTDSISQSRGAEFKGDFERQIADAYNAHDYGKAISMLEQKKDEQLARGLESADLYYNLGNAYFRDGEVAKALLYYERALLIKPNDKDIRQNIAFANTRIEDKIETGQTFFLTDWINSVQQIMSSNGWAWFAIVIFIVFIGCLFMFFFSKTVAPKQVAFYVGLLSVILIIMGNVFAFRQKRRVLNHDSAIIMVPSVVVHSSPDKSSNQVFSLHSGTKVKVRKTDREWCEVEIASGSVGWIPQDKLEKI